MATFGRCKVPTLSDFGPKLDPGVRWRAGASACPSVVRGGSVRVGGRPGPWRRAPAARDVLGRARGRASVQRLPVVSARRGRVGGSELRPALWFERFVAVLGSCLEPQCRVVGAHGRLDGLSHGVLAAARWSVEVIGPNRVAGLGATSPRASKRFTITSGPRRVQKKKTGSQDHRRRAASTAAALVSAGVAYRRFSRKRCCAR